MPLTPNDRHLLRDLGEGPVSPAARDEVRIRIARRGLEGVAETLKLVESCELDALETDIEFLAPLARIHDALRQVTAAAGELADLEHALRRHA